MSNESKDIDFSECAKHIESVEEDHLKDFFKCYKRLLYSFFISSVVNFKEIYEYKYNVNEQYIGIMTRAYSREHLIYNINNVQALDHEINCCKKIGLFFFIIGKYLPILAEDVTQEPILKDQTPLSDDDDFTFKVNFDFFIYTALFLID